MINLFIGMYVYGLLATAFIVEHVEEERQFSIKPILIIAIVILHPLMFAWIVGAFIITKTWRAYRFIYWKTKSQEFKDKFVADAVEKNRTDFNIDGEEYFEYDEEDDFLEEELYENNRKENQG